jgi:UDP-N-acetylglucosamine 4,6-dehydratase
LNSILITGGTGSFGQAFTRAALDRGVERICVYSRGERCQAEMREQLPDSRLRWFIGDVRDRDRLRRAMEGCDVVIHAAALKRIEIGEYNPSEMVRTNVGGALNAIEAAQDAGVQRVVALSTDKACEPVNAYGASKLMAEKLFLAANNTTGKLGPVYCVTRYGNVAGSNGSVIPTWRRMIDGGVLEVPVTDPECTRYWMTMREAVELVWEVATSSVALIRDVIVPCLPAYRLGDLAAAMGVGMRIVGLRDGEKLHESMLCGQTSEDARRMSVDEIREALATI